MTRRGGAGADLWETAADPRKHADPVTAVTLFGPLGNSCGKPLAIVVRMDGTTITLHRILQRPPGLKRRFRRPR
jgi:hypothetical protein